MIQDSMQASTKYNLFGKKAITEYIMGYEKHTVSQLFNPRENVIVKHYRHHL